MIDVVIPLGNGSQHNDMELRYALRSIEKHLKNYRNIYIIGECPAWGRNIIHIPYADHHSSLFKERNVCNKLIHACSIPGISQQFLYFNDDHFLLQDVNANEFPYHHKGTLQDGFKITKSSYKISLKNTINALRGKKTAHFDTHCPILFDKTLFPQIMSQYDWKRGYGYVIKSIYCNTLGIEGELYPDLKLWIDNYPGYKQSIQGRPYFSIGDKAINDDLITLLNEIYQFKSFYEL